MAKSIDTNITIIRIDPTTQAIARMRKQFGSSNYRVVNDVKKIVRATEIDLRQLQVIEDVRLIQFTPSLPGKAPETKDVGGTPLLVAAGANKEENVVGWRLLGCEDTMGIGILFGQGVGGGMVDCPVDLEWVRKRIRWIPGETDAEIAARAEAFVRSANLEHDKRPALALINAIDLGPFQAGDSTMWVDAEVYADVIEALLLYDLTDGPSEGRRLTRFGDAVRAVLVQDAAA